MWFYPKTGQISQISEQPRWIKILLSIQIVGIFTIEYLKPACLSTPGYWDYSSMMSTSRSQKVKQYDWSTVITSLPCRNLTFVSTSFLSQWKFRTIFCYGKKKKTRFGEKKKKRRGQVRLCTSAILWNSTWPQSVQEATKCYLHSNAPKIFS